MPALTLLFCGDVVGKPGRKALADYLPKVIEQYKVDFTVINAENAAGGFGITPEIAQELYGYGADVLTLGNHTWDKKETESQLETDRKLLRPLNYPAGTVGTGFRVFEAKNGKRVAVLSLMGRLFMENGLDCPFQASRQLLKDNRLGTDYDALVVDIHAEATSEKRCLAHIFDGRASMVVGSHTHVPTADDHIMPKGTAFQTDTGMCGFYDSSVGMTFETALPRFERKGRNQSMQVENGPGTLCGVVVQVNDNGLATSVKAIRIGGVLQPTA